MNELCSIIMPVHNPLYGFQDSIESILNQTYKNIELIIVNDNSSSKYTEIIESYKNNHKCIKVFNLKFSFKVINEIFSQDKLALYYTLEK